MCNNFIKLLFIKFIINKNLYYQMDYNKKNSNNNVSQYDATIIDYSNKDPLDLNINSFLNPIDDCDKTMHGISTSNDLLIIDDCSNEHKTVKGMFKRKFDSLKLVLKWWKEGNILSVINALKIMKDKIIMNDFFNYAIIKGNKEHNNLKNLDSNTSYNIDYMSSLKLNYDLYLEILPMLIKLISEKYDNYINVGLGSSSILINYFIDILYPKTKSSNNIDEIDKAKKVIYSINEFRKTLIIDKILKKQYSSSLYAYASSIDNKVNYINNNLQFN